MEERNCACSCQVALVECVCVCGRSTHEKLLRPFCEISLYSAKTRKPFIVGERVILVHVVGAAEEVMCTAKSNKVPHALQTAQVAREGKLCCSLDDH